MIFKQGENIIERIISNGLPQGSALSPMLFNIYTTPLHAISDENTEIIQYADDIAMIIKGKSLKKIELIIQEKIKKFNKMIKDLKFEMNISKTKFMIMKNNTQHNIKIIINNEQIKEVNVYKYLGIHIDKGLTFNKQIIEMKDTINSRINIIKIFGGMFKGGHPTTLINVHRSLIRSYIEYGQTFYGNASKKNLKYLETILRRSLRTILGLTKSTPINSISILAGEPEINIRRKYYTKKEIIMNIANNTRVGKQLLELNEIEEKKHYSYLEKIYLENKNHFVNIEKKVLNIYKQVNDKIFIDTELADNNYINKKNETNIQMKNKTLELLNHKYKNKIKIYTDASKKEEKCGIGFYNSETKEGFNYKLENNVEIMSAEIMAISKAMEYIKNKNLKNGIILTDSLSGCKYIRTQLKNEFTINHIIKEIINIGIKNNITICWIPAHVGITGNEIADKFANEGVNNENNKIQNNEFITDKLNKFKETVKTEWKLWYETISEEKGKLCNKFIKNFEDKPWYLSQK